MASSGRRILLGVSGSIAAVKTPELVRLLVDKQFSVQCVLTKGATQFVAPLALATFSGKKVFQDIFEDDAYQLPHIVHTEEADLFVVAPATATLLAEFAMGMAHDMVSLCYVTTRKPVLIAPAMHPSMWEHPATQSNVETLRKRGVHFSGPAMGPMADNTHGDGRMSEPSEIVSAIEKILKK